MQNQRDVENRSNGKGNMAAAKERGSTKREHRAASGRQGEDHIEGGEWKPACIGEAADVQVFKHVHVGGLGRRDEASLPGAV